MAAENRCYLCGGKLVAGHCQDCGLDNNRNKKVKYRLNQTEGADQLDQADEHELRKELKSKAKEHQKKHREIRKERAKRAERWQGSPQNKSAVKANKKAGTLVGVLIVLMLIIGGVMMVIRTANNNGGITTYEFDEDVDLVPSPEAGEEP